jgi:hypothetical protein
VCVISPRPAAVSEADRSATRVRSCDGEHQSHLELAGDWYVRARYFLNLCALAFPSALAFAPGPPGLLLLLLLLVLLLLLLLLLFAAAALLVAAIAAMHPSNFAHWSLSTARDLTLEAARDASNARKAPTRPLPSAQLKKLLDSRSERDVLEGLRRVVTVCPALPCPPALPSCPAPPIHGTLHLEHPAVDALVADHGHGACRCPTDSRRRRHCPSSRT